MSQECKNRCIPSANNSHGNMGMGDIVDGGKRRKDSSDTKDNRMCE